jgi:group I intron endonuclease
MKFLSVNGKNVIGEEVNRSMQFSGIYAIINKTNNKMYIGKSINVYERLLGHFNHLNNNKHVNLHLQSSFNKYEGHFIAILLEKCERDLLDDRERFYISYYETFNQSSKGYNMTFGGDGMLGYRFTDETKQKISEKMTGIKKSEETKKKISESTKGLKRSDSTKKRMSESRKKLGIHPNTRNRKVESNSIAIVQVDFEGNITHWISASVASKVLAIDCTGIRKCCRKQMKTYKNSFWFNKEEYEQLQPTNLVDCI